MTTTASCGHTVENGDDLVVCVLARYDRQDDRCVHYVAYCQPCYKEAQDAGEVLYDEGEVNKWLQLT